MLMQVILTDDTWQALQGTLDYVKKRMNETGDHEASQKYHELSEAMAIMHFNAVEIKDDRKAHANWAEMVRQQRAVLDPIRKESEGV